VFISVIDSIFSEYRQIGGYSYVWSGEFENLERARKQLKIIVPITLFIVFLLLFFNFRSIAKTLIVLLSIPFSLIGGFLLMYLLNYNLSIASWVGFIALAGVAAETGVVMIVYLDEVFDKYKEEGRLNTFVDLVNAVMEGAVQRVRPKMMVVVSIIAGLIPIFWGDGIGSDVMRRIAAPMIGGMITSTMLTLVIIPALYTTWRQIKLKLE